MVKSCYSVVAFDLDGTLVDTVPDLYYAANLMLYSLHLPAVTIESVRLWIGDGIEQLVLRVLSLNYVVNPRLNPQLCQRATSIFKQYYLDNVCRSSKVYPQVEKCLQDLKSTDVILVVVTNKARLFTVKLLKALNLSDYFAMVVCGDDLLGQQTPNKKPSPLPILHIADKLNIPIAQLLVVGDSKNDMISAQNAGCDRAFVRYGYHQGVKIEQYTPKFVVDDLGQLTSLIHQPNKAEISLTTNCNQTIDAN